MISKPSATGDLRWFSLHKYHTFTLIRLYPVGVSACAYPDTQEIQDPDFLPQLQRDLTGCRSAADVVSDKWNSLMNTVRLGAPEIGDSALKLASIFSVNTVRQSTLQHLAKHLILQRSRSESQLSMNLLFLRAVWTMLLRRQVLLCSWSLHLL